MKRKNIIALLLAIGVVSGSNVTISTDYPGGNVKTGKETEESIEVEADLRDTPQPWFYWNFEAKAKSPGRIRFLFPAGQGQLSAQGPAFSTDNGKTWQWLGKDKVSFKEQDTDGKRDSFSWEFKNEGETVRFAQGIPYLKADFDRMIDKYRDNPNLKISSLTKTRKGKDVPLLIIGKESSDTGNMLITARHHACEAMASYVFEGFLKELLSDSPFAKEFRSKYVLYAVPFVDLDGVEAGDQGKGRAPHDHNRDYALSEHLYPEVQAITELDKEKKFAVAVDFHCPAVRRDIHESFYFDGYRSPENQANLTEFLKWLSEEVPPVCGNTINLTKSKFREPSGKQGTSFSYYFAARPEIAFAVTLEVPYANRNYGYDAAAAEAYGQAFFRAMTRMGFVRSPNPQQGYAEFRKMSNTLNGAPAAFVAKAEAVLNDPNAPQLYKTEAHLRLGWIYPRMRKFAEALQNNSAVLASPYASTRQKMTAAAQQTQAYCADRNTTDETMDQWIGELKKLNPGGPSGYSAYGDLYLYSIRKNNPEAAFEYAQKQLENASSFQVGHARNRIAAYYLNKGDKDKAAEYSRETVEYLKKQLYPKMPVGVFGPQQAEELVNALLMIPGTPKEEIIEAANLALNHKYCQNEVRQRLTAILEKLNQ
jgi:hypothetical protein